MGSLQSLREVAESLSLGVCLELEESQFSSENWRGCTRVLLTRDRTGEELTLLQNLAHS